MRYSHLLHLRWWGIGEGYIFETRCLPATVDTRRQMTRFQPYWPRQTATNLRRKVGLPFQLGEYFARGTHFRSANRQWSTEASKIQRNEHDRYAPVRLRKPAELSSIRWVSDSKNRMAMLRICLHVPRHLKLTLPRCLPAEGLRFSTLIIRLANA